MLRFSVPPLFIRLTIWFVAGSVTSGSTVAQNNFNSGSTGADGAFAPTASQTIQVPESGVFNFTTINIPGGVTITFTRNSRNTPVTLLASGNVTISGVIRVDGQAGAGNGNSGLGGSGGYMGGSGGLGFSSFTGISGDGPGGGGSGGSINGASFGGGGGGGFALAGGNGLGQNVGAGGARYGSSTLLPLIGGSGGGGGGAATGKNGGGGGGGGGAILIASSGSITFGSGGQINAKGGDGGRIFLATDGGSGGGGSGGAIRLVANTISAPNTASLDVRGGTGGGQSFGGSINGGNGAVGYLRVEAFDRSGLNLSTSSVPVSFALPNALTVANAPQLRITSVAGVSAPASPLGSLQGQPDVIIPTSQTNPVNVVIEATNVPVGLNVQVTVIPANGNRATVQSNPLNGTDAASSTTASVALPAGTSLLSAVVVIDLTQANAAPLFKFGERIDRIEVAATFGGVSEVIYITRAGRRIKESQ
ncbi:MAG: hypothetical protein AB1757_30480 [Acidobacteriota bacterium]